MGRASGELLAGKYRLISLLGKGGMGDVWRAHHEVLDAPVAVKLMHARIENADSGAARFLREAKAAAAVRSPNVVQILDYGFEGETPFIVMELLEGTSLKALIEQGPLSPERTARIVGDVARGLSRAHALGIVHRDLKPDNVFVVRNVDQQVAKVLDFGVAKNLEPSSPSEAQTSTGALLGTPVYMSPEQLDGAGRVDARSDLWALGVIAFECLVGTRPFAADGLIGLIQRITAEPPPVPSQVASLPEGFDAWFARAVAREPHSRFTTALEMARALRAALGLADEPGLDSVDAESAPPVETAPTVAATPARADAQLTTHGTGTASLSVEAPAAQRGPWLFVGGVVAVVATLLVAASRGGAGETGAEGGGADERAEALAAQRTPSADSGRSLGAPVAPPSAAPAPSAAAAPSVPPEAAPPVPAATPAPGPRSAQPRRAPLPAPAAPQPAPRPVNLGI